MLNGESQMQQQGLFSQLDVYVCRDSGLCFSVKLANFVLLLAN